MRFVHSIFNWPSGPVELAMPPLICVNALPSLHYLRRILQVDDESFSITFFELK